jgi:hypothetical protein
MGLVMSDNDSGQLVRCVGHGEDVIPCRVERQGQDLLDIRPGVELVAGAVCKDVLWQ